MRRGAALTENSPSRRASATQKMVRRGTPGNPADAGALVVEEFAYSHAQRAYQAEVGNRAPELIPRKPKPGEPAPTPGERGEVFYKDATPKADHFMQFRVRLPRALRATVSSDVVLDLTLCFAPNHDTDEYVVVADQSHLRKCDAPRGEPRGARENLLGAILRFRVELGSYRQGDKRFVIKASLSEEEARKHGLPALQSAYTTPVYVASKVKRSRMAAHRQQQQQHDDDDASVSPMPPSRRQRVGHPAAPRMPSLTAVDLSQLQARLDGLEELLVERVLPILDRLDDRLAATAPNNDEERPAAQDSLAELVRAPTWSDAVAAMGRGMGEAKDALLSFSLSQDSQDGPPPPPPAQE